MQMDRREFIKYCAGAAALGCAGACGFAGRALADPPLLDSSFLYDCPALEEITVPGPVILPDGTCRCGWMRRPLLDLNFEDAQFLPSKAKMAQAMKKWDMYHLVTPDYAMQFLIAWIPYSAFFNANIFDRKTGKLYEDTRFLPASPKNPMMRDSTRGLSEFKSPDVTARFEVDGEHHRISVNFDGFNLAEKDKADVNLAAGDKLRTSYKFDADLLLPAGYDSIASVHPTTPKQCHFGHKINCMQVTGGVTFRDKTTELRPDGSFGALDFGRGYYPRKMFWYWATASGLAPDGKPIGFNLGYGNNPDNTAENAVFYDGKITKINKVVCTVPTDKELMKPWSVRDKEGLVDLTYTPQKVREINTQIGSGYSVGRPALGMYSGKLVTAAGKTIEVKDIFGTYEWVNSKW